MKMLERLKKFALRLKGDQHLPSHSREVMAFHRRNRNRRRVDAAHRQEAVQDVLRRYGLPLARALLGFSLLGGLGWGGIHLREWMLSSPRFALQTVAFTGLQRAPEAELLRLSGLTVGQNVFRLDLAAAERAVQGHPWVRHVRLRRELPVTVRVDVDEHVPVAMAALGDLYLVDAEGEPFKRLEPQDGVDLPLLTGVERDAYVQDAGAVARQFRQALSVANAYEASGAGQKARLSEIRVGGEGTVLLTDAGQEIHFAEGPSDEALRRLFKVRAELSRRGLLGQSIYLDNRVRPDRVTVKLAAAAGTQTGGASVERGFTTPVDRSATLSERIRVASARE